MRMPLRSVAEHGHLLRANEGKILSRVCWNLCAY
jgi:hypothetical protein